MRLATLQERLLRDGDRSGIDFVEVRSRDVFRVYFVHRQVQSEEDDRDSIDLGSVSTEDVTLEGPAPVAATGVDFGVDDGRGFLEVRVSPDLGGSRFRLRIRHPRIHPDLATAELRFAVDRIEALRAQGRVTGIDYIRVEPETQDRLDVHFLVPPSALAEPFPVSGEDAPGVEVRIEPTETGDPRVAVTETAWVDAGDVLRVRTNRPGGWSAYRLTIDDARLDDEEDGEPEGGGLSRVDPYFNGILFSFKAACPHDLDCAVERPVCPPEDEVDFPVDYTARDFWSLRRALHDFASQRYPDWKDRLPADAGNMLLEVMSALGDELSYYQDRIARQAYLEDATERRSLRHHAALVDHDLHDGQAATTWLDIEVKPAVHGVRTIKAGTPVWAESDNGGRIQYEIGRGMADLPGQAGSVPLRYPEDARSYRVSAARNSLRPHIWDEDDVCLDAGATALFVRGDQREALGWPEDASDGGDETVVDDRVRHVLIRTRPLSAAIPERRVLVYLTAAELAEDPLPDDAGGAPPRPVTRLQWRDEDALPFQLDLTVAEVRANLVPATAGRTVRYRFVTGADPQELLPNKPAWMAPDNEKLFDWAEQQRQLTRAVEREALWREEPRSAFPGQPVVGKNVKPEMNAGHRGTMYLFSEPDSLARILDRNGEPFDAPTPELLPSETPLTRRAEPEQTPRQAVPEMRLLEIDLVWQTDHGWLWAPQRPWHWRRSLVRGHASLPQDRHYTIEHGTWKRVVGYRRDGGEIVHRDYFSGDGTTVRFGDGQFGRVPARPTVFELTCRLGNGRATNVAADAIAGFDADELPFVEHLHNPLAAADGVDPETPQDVRQTAPEAFRALTFRAVRPADYAEAAERLDWVQRAGATFRWTGSWITAFVAADPRGATLISEERDEALTNQVDRFRQAGRQAWVIDPKYADIDLAITVCVAPNAYRGEVKERVLEVLLGDEDKGIPGFFAPDNFTFGSSLSRSRLEAAIQRVAGVRAVVGIRIRRRGVFDWRELDSLFVPMADDEIVRLEHDPDHPDRGTLQLETEGGA